MTLKIQKIDLSISDNEKLSQELEQVGTHQIQIANWEKEFPYKPKVSFQVAHNGDFVAIKYKVEEKYIRAEATENNGNVWEDSCCEFFISFNGKQYYNLETNCIGTKLMNYGIPGSRNSVGDAIIDKISTQSSLGKGRLASQEGDYKWEMLVVIPKGSFTEEKLETLSGTKASANFYKCGDKTKEAHFLSWKPIDLPQPNFHCPEFFSPIEFE